MLITSIGCFILKHKKIFCDVWTLFMIYVFCTVATTFCISGNISKCICQVVLLQSPFFSWYWQESNKLLLGSLMMFPTVFVIVFFVYLYFLYQHFQYWFCCLVNPVGCQYIGICMWQFCFYTGCTLIIASLMGFRYNMIYQHIMTDNIYFL